MGWLEDAEALANMPIPGPGVSAETRHRLDTMPVEALAALFCAHQYLTLRELTHESHDAMLYFDHLPHEQPERAFALVLAVLRAEAPKPVKMELNTRLFGALLYRHGEAMIETIEREVMTNAQLRWLAGGACNSSHPDVSRRMQAFADQDAWWEDYEERRRPKRVIDFPRLSAVELARAWVDHKVCPHKDQDENSDALEEHMTALQRDDPDAVLDVILEILKIETDVAVLSFLAAGPLEDLVSDRTIDRIEREAQADEKFRELLRGVWYWNEDHELKRRLDAITGLNYANS